MNPVLLARVIGLGRVAFGAGMVAKPPALTARWIGRDAGRGGTQVVVRALGARDLLLGLGAATTSGPEQRRWVLASIAADAADLSATLGAGADVPLSGRIVVGLVAGGAIALGAASLAGLSSPSAS